MEKKTARKVHKDINFKMLILLVAVFMIVVAIVGITACSRIKEATVIGETVYANSVHLGGLTVEEATQKLEEEISADYFNKKVQINYMDKTYEVDLLGVVAIDAKKTAEAALDKTNEFLSKIKNEEKVVVPFTVSVNSEDAAKNVLFYFSEFENESGVFTFNKDHTSVDVDASKIQEIMNIDGTLELIFKNAENDVYDAVDAVVLKNGDDGFAEELYKRLSRPAKDASVGMNDDGSTYIIPEVVGIEADKDEFLKLYGKNDGKFTMDVKSTAPAVTTADLDIDFYQDVLGSYTSTYNASLVNRTKNVTLAASLVNGTVIMPGKRFSYNSVVGPRTYARGFVNATVFTGEGTEEGIGGGICQVSSTIYCAQLRANLKTIARRNHSYTVVYVPLGQDATVVYGVLDYIFENDTNYPIKVEATTGGGRLTVRILGTKTDKSLSYDVVSVTNSTIAKGEVRKETPDLPAGQTVVKQNGQNGAVVTAYKVYYKNGVEQKREFISKDTYVAMKRIVMVGTGGAVTDGVVDDTGDSVTDVNPDGDVVIPGIGTVIGGDGETVTPEGEGTESGVNTESSTGTENSGTVETPVVPENTETNTENNTVVPETNNNNSVPDAPVTDVPASDVPTSDTGL